MSGLVESYVFADRQVYIAEDTENTPEMKELAGIDYAFLPMNPPYTMTPEMVADAARALKPKALYPYHYGATEVKRLVRLLADSPGIEVRIRKMEVGGVQLSVSRPIPRHCSGPWPNCRIWCNFAGVAKSHVMAKQKAAIPM